MMIIIIIIVIIIIIFCIGINAAAAERNVTEESFEIVSAAIFTAANVHLSRTSFLGISFCEVETVSRLLEFKDH